MVEIPHRGPRRGVFLDVERPEAAVRAARADADDHARMRRYPQPPVRGQRRATAAENQVNRACLRVDHVGPGGDGARPQGLALPIGAAQRMRAFIVVLVPAYDQVDAVAIEEREELLADA